MREILSMSLGTHSNFVSTHFWNSQDENLKVLSQSGEPNLDQAIKKSTDMVYYETPITNQLLPRHILIDF